jgi:hypothetical protein
MGAAKNSLFADVSEKKFSLLRIERVSNPNSTFIFVLKPVGGNPPGEVSLTTSPGALAMELERIVRWLQETAPAA